MSVASQNQAGKEKPIVGYVTFLFGAGASFGADSGQVSPERPPLMREVYDRLARRFPSGWGPSSKRGEFANEYRADFEKTFTEVDLGRRKEYPPGTPGVPASMAIEAQRTLAIYFSEFRLDSSRKDLYSRLLTFLRRSRIIDSSLFASLNYDCLFEQAAVNQGLPCDYLMDAAQNQLNGTAGDWPGQRGQRAAVFFAKLHGSSNFAIPQAAVNFFRLQGTSPGTSVETGIEILNPFTPFSGKKVADIWPVMTQTSPNRDDFASPAHIQQVRNVWRMAASSAKLLVLVGVGPREYDSHVWEAIKSANGEVVCLGSRSQINTWRRCNPRIRCLSDDFRKGFRRLLLSLARTRKRQGGSLLAYMRDIVYAFLC